MPTYVYRCKKGHTFELFHSISDDAPKRCPECRSGAARVPSGGAGLLFKGSGFYITDYRSKGYTESAKQEKGGGDSGGDSGGEKSASKPSEPGQPGKPSKPSEPGQPGKPSKPSETKADKSPKKSSGKSGSSSD